VSETAASSISAPLPSSHALKPVHTAKPSSTGVSNSTLGPDPFEHH
jgi:hypothetical protein